MLLNSHVPTWSCFGWGLPCQLCHQNCGALLPQPFHPYLSKTTGGLFSVALSLRSPSLDVIQHPDPVKPGLSSSPFLKRGQQLSGYLLTHQGITRLQRHCQITRKGEGVFSSLGQGREGRPQIRLKPSLLQWLLSRSLARASFLLWPQGLLYLLLAVLLVSQTLLDRAQKTPYLPVLHPL